MEETLVEELEELEEIPEEDDKEELSWDELSELENQE